MIERFVFFTVLFFEAQCSWGQDVYEGYPAYYETINGVIFKSNSAIPFAGFRKGAVNWNGHHFPVREAIIFPREIAQNDSLGDHAMSYETPEFGCVEGSSSSASGTAIRYKSVYLIDLRSPKTAKLYKLPSLFGSCLAVRTDGNGRVLLDAADYSYEAASDDPVGVAFREHELSGRGFSPTGRVVKARFVDPENVWKFAVDAAN